MFSRSHFYSDDSICRWCAETGNITASKVFTIYLVDAGLSAIFLNGQDVWHGDVDMEMILKSVASLSIFLLLLSLISCNQDDGEQSDVQMLSALLPVSPLVSVVGPKRLRFSWDDVGADHYRLLKNPDGSSGYSPVGDDITTTSVDEVIAVHLTDWPNVSYLVEACGSDDSCVDSAPLSISTLMIDAIGSLQPHYDPQSYEAFSPDCFSVLEHCFGHAITMSGDGAVIAVGYGTDDVDARDINGIPNEPYDSEMGPNSGAVFLYTQQGVGWSIGNFIKASNADAGDYFGTSVSLSHDGTLLAVGAPYEDSSASGLNGDQGDNMLENTGAVYLFSHDEAGWREQTYLKLRNSAQGDDRFGLLVSLSSMGDRLAVGGRENIYLFHDDGAGWRLEAEWDMTRHITDNDTYNGIFALSGDGLTLALAVSADPAIWPETVSPGFVSIYVFDGGEWVEQGRVTASNADDGDNFGGSLSLSDDGNTLAVGASGEDSSALGVNGDETDNSAESSGAAYLFERQEGVWRQSVYLKASNTQQDDYFGAKLVLSGDGRSLVVTASGEDSLARGINGSQTDDNSEAPPGAAYLFVRDGAEWFQKAYIKSPYTNSGHQYELPLCGPVACFSNDNFGDDLAISDDGSFLAIGAPGAGYLGPGRVYLY
jgi:hypothetical protein